MDINERTAAILVLMQRPDETDRLRRHRRTQPADLERAWAYIHRCQNIADLLGVTWSRPTSGWVPIDNW